jgi:hypothetical protein
MQIHRSTFGISLLLSLCSLPHVHEDKPRTLVTEYTFSTLLLDAIKYNTDINVMKKVWHRIKEPWQLAQTQTYRILNVATEAKERRAIDGGGDDALRFPSVPTADQWRLSLPAI